VTGQKDRVAEVVATIRKEMYVSVEQRSKADQMARKAVGLPGDTNHIPSYWTVIVFSRYCCIWEYRKREWGVGGGGGG
jgi:hypothetical protein